MEKKKQSFGLSFRNKNAIKTKGVISQTKNDKDNSISLILQPEEESKDFIKLIPPSLNIYGSKKPEPNSQLHLNPMNIQQESLKANSISPFSQVKKPSISSVDTGGNSSIRKKGN
jgi:hypothetical protein